MRAIAKVSILLVAATCFSLAQVNVVTTYNTPLLPGTSQDSVLNGLGSIRSVWFDTDLDGDGMGEIIVTNYNDKGHVHVFEVVSDNTVQLVWSSPTVATGGSGSTPRWVTTGDLDNDGRKEIIFELNDNGVYIFEWDGVNGSDNYGTTYSQLIDTTALGLTGTVIDNTEYFEVTDIDGNGTNELVMAMNNSGNSNDRYWIISAIGGWSTNSPGLSSFTTDFMATRTDLAPWGLSGGSPVSLISANLDGTGKKEMIVHNWNLKNVTILRDSLGTWAFADTAVQPPYNLKKTQLYLTTPNDGVALFSGFAFDIDRDGREEVYLPTYGSALYGGNVDMIYYNPGDSINVIDSANVMKLDYTSLTTGSAFGFGYGDIDGDHNYEIYIGGSKNFNVVQLEFQIGGDKTSPASWTPSVLYAGDTTIYTAMTILDSAGVRVDTLSRTVDGSFVSKMYARKSDFDKDGKEDIIMPFQALSDSITITHYTWNADSAWYDTTSSKVVNPKRFGFRVLEGSVNTTGIEVRDLRIIMPDDYILEQNFPNPFNPTTTIRFILPIRNRVSLKIYDMLGREVRTLVNREEYAAGPSQVVWDGKSNSGQTVSSGTYFYSLIYGNFKKTMKMSFVK